MNIGEIPFNKFIGIKSGGEEGSVLYLEFKANLQNHLGTFHAGAQFALAEACSGYCLQKNFPLLENSVIPVLRKADVKFKKVASSNIQAKAEIKAENKEKFERQFKKKGRASLSVTVDIMTQDGTVVMTGTYDWFIQTIEFAPVNEKQNRHN